MTNKMKLLIGLLVLVIVLLGAGLVFLLISPRQNGIKITLTPAPGTYLFNDQNQPSDVLLQTVQIDKSVSDLGYTSTGHVISVNPGDPILILSGNIQNNQRTNKEIAIYADGYDVKGEQVAWTLDGAHIVGQIGLHIETGETGQFILHMNFAKNIKSISIFANTYDQIPP